MMELQNRKYFKISYSVILNAVIMAIFLLLFPLRYEMPDDFVFSNLITDGSYNFNFMSPAMASIMGFTQNLIYPVNAYVIVCLVTAFFACVAITYVFADKFNPIITFCFTLMFNGFLGVNHYETIAYTRMAALMSVAGLLCIIHYSSKEKGKLGTISGIVFLILGSLYRFAIFEVCVAAAVFFVLGKSLADYFSSDKSERKSVDILKKIFEPRRLVSAIIAVVLCFSITYISEYIIKSDPHVDYFIKYTAARSDVYDYSLPDYETHKKEYAVIDIDENDLKMLRNLYMDDEGAFTYDKLKEIKSVKDSVDSVETSLLEKMKLMVICEIGNIRAVWKNGTIDIRNFGIMAGNKGIAYFFVGILLIIFLLTMKKRNYFIPIMLSIITLILYIYLWRELKVPFRAVYPLWISFSTYLMYSFSWVEIRPYVIKLYKLQTTIFVSFAVVFCILFSVIGVYLSTIYNQYIDYYTLTDSQINLCNYLSENTDKKYELSTNCSYGTLTDNIWFTKKTDLRKNYNGFSGTYYRLPYRDYEAIKFGTDNMCSNLLNDNIYFVVDSEESHAEMMKNYLQKYYSDGETVEYKIVDTVDKYQICKYLLK